MNSPLYENCSRGFGRSGVLSPHHDPRASYEYSIPQFASREHTIPCTFNLRGPPIKEYRGALLCVYTVTRLYVLSRWMYIHTRLQTIKLPARKLCPDFPLCVSDDVSFPDAQRDSQLKQHFRSFRKLSPTTPRILNKFRNNHQNNFILENLIDMKVHGRNNSAKLRGSSNCSCDAPHF